MSSASGMDEERPHLFSQLVQQLNSVNDHEVMNQVWDRYRIEDYYKWVYIMEASEAKWINLILNIIGVKSLRIGGLHICDISLWTFNRTDTHILWEIEVSSSVFVAQSPKMWKDVVTKFFIRKILRNCSIGLRNIFLMIEKTIMAGF